MFNPLQSRTLKVACDSLPKWGGADVLIVQRVEGVETLGELAEFRLAFTTLDVPSFRVYQARDIIKPDELIGKTIEISVEFEGKGTFIPGLPGNLGAGNVGAGVRKINGLITEVRQTGSDDKRAYCQFTVRPWLWVLSKNCDNRIFQDMNVLEITEEVFRSRDIKFPWTKRLAAVALNNNVFPKRDFVRQFWQSDYDFLRQIWSEWGLYFYFDGMTLVLCDSPGSHLKHGNAYDTILYHAPESSFEVHSAGRNFTGPDSIASPVLPESKPGQEDLHFTLGALAHNQAHRYVEEPYELFKGDTKIGQGVTDEFGRVVVKDHQAGTSAYHVKLSNGGKFDLKVKDALDADSAHTNRRLNRGERRT